MTAGSIALGAADSDGKPKSKRVGKMMGLLNRKKGSSQGIIGEGGGDANSDAMSVASSTFSSVSRAPTMFNRDLSSNGLMENTIRPVVRKVNDHKMILWPPDEYFDAVTPKVRQPALEWVYGYSGFSNRNNMFLLKDGSVLMYFAGNIVVLLELNTESQRWYSEHDGVIKVKLNDYTKVFLEKLAGFFSVPQCQKTVRSRLQASNGRAMRFR